MLVQHFILEQYDWSIKVYYAVYRYYVEDILKDLDDLNISNYEYLKVKQSLYKEEVNTGFTYTDYNKKTSVIVIGLTTSAAEFQNTFDHEKGHVVMHISEYYHINPYSEDFQYLAGDIGKKMFPYAKSFLCDCCREGFTLYN